MSLNKANRFIRHAKANGWGIKYQILSKKNEAIRVTATRASERIVIEWSNNQLSYSPEYHLHEMQLKIHSRKDAEALLERIKPDYGQYHRWQSRKKASGESAEEELVVSLPFSIEEDDDETILRTVRGSTLIFRNSISGETESVWVPDKAGGKMYNRDTEHVFFLADNEQGRPWLSFMDANGCFRAVHLDRLIGVV